MGGSKRFYTFPRKFKWSVSCSLTPPKLACDWHLWKQLGHDFPLSLWPPHFHEQTSIEAVIDFLKEAHISNLTCPLFLSDIMPTPHQINTDAIQVYVNRLRQLKTHGISVTLILHPFIHPTWFHEQTPWHSPSSVESFLRPFKQVIPILMPFVDQWITFNEMNAWLFGAYFEGCFPPGHMNPHLTAMACRNIIECHVKLYDYLKQTQLKLGFDQSVGLSLHTSYFYPSRKTHLGDWAKASFMTRVYQQSFFDIFKKGTWAGTRYLKETPIDLNFAKGALDFMGLTYFSQTAVKSQADMPFKAKPSPSISKSPLSLLNWESSPKGLYKVLKQCATYKIPLYICDNSFPSLNEQAKSRVVHQNLFQIKKALENKVPLKGYCYGALYDSQQTKHQGIASWDAHKRRLMLNKSGIYYSGTVKTNTMMLHA